MTVVVRITNLLESVQKVSRTVRKWRGSHAFSSASGVLRVWKGTRRVPGQVSMAGFMAPKIFGDWDEDKHCDTQSVFSNTSQVALPI